MPDLAADLAAESAVLRALLVGLDEPGWRRATPADGWTIADQVSHLAYFDDAALLAATEPEAFVEERQRLEAAGAIDPDVVAADHRDLSGAALLAWFDWSRSTVVRTFAALDSDVRVPWFGPAMSAASALTARIMETWAHGQDVADALGVVREPTARLRHVAHLGVAARGYSFGVHGRPVPDTPVRVELGAPDGSLWTWGSRDAADRVTGTALVWSPAAGTRPTSAWRVRTAEVR